MTLFHCKKCGFDIEGNITYRDVILEEYKEAVQTLGCSHCITKLINILNKKKV